MTVNRPEPKPLGTTAILQQTFPFRGNDIGVRWVRDFANEVNFFNLATHDIVFYVGEQKLVVPPSGFVLRLDVEKLSVEEPIAGLSLETCGLIVNDIPVELERLLALYGGRTIYLASMPVAQALAHRGDVYHPNDDVVRDEKRRPIGSRGLRRYLADR